MSRASAYVRLPDGTVRYALYEGTSDTFYRQTYPTLSEAWDRYHNGDRDQCSCEHLIRADYWQDYGSGTLTVIDYCPGCERLRPERGDFFEHCDTVGVEHDGSDEQPESGWMRQYAMPEWWVPIWVVDAAVQGDEMTKRIKGASHDVTFCDEPTESSPLMPRLLSRVNTRKIHIQFTDDVRAIVLNGKLVWVEREPTTDEDGLIL